MKVKSTKKFMQVWIKVASAKNPNSKAFHFEPKLIEVEQWLEAEVK